MRIRRKAHLDGSELRFRKAKAEEQHERIQLTSTGGTTTTDGGVGTLIICVSEFSYLLCTYYTSLSVLVY